MNDDEIKKLVAAVVVAFSHLDLSMAVKVEVLERAAAEFRLMDLVDEAALRGIVEGDA